MAARLTRLILGILLLIGQFLDPATRWLSWGVVFFLLFEGVTNIRFMEILLRRWGMERSSPPLKDLPDKT